MFVRNRLVRAGFSKKGTLLSWSNPATGEKGSLCGYAVDTLPQTGRSTEAPTQSRSYLRPVVASARGGQVHLDPAPTSGRFLEIRIPPVPGSKCAIPKSVLLTGPPPKPRRDTAPPGRVPAIPPVLDSLACSYRARLTFQSRNAQNPRSGFHGREDFPTAGW